jgi:hypothetical protein
MKPQDDKSRPQGHFTGSQGKALAKQEYRTPTLTVYGDVREITRGPALGSRRDGTTTSYTE